MRCLLLTVALLFAFNAHAEKIKAYEGGLQKVTDTDIGSHFKQYQKTEAYLEQWRVVVSRADKGWMELSVVLTNLGPGDGRAAVDIQRYSYDIGKPDTPHSYYRWPKHHERGSWKASPKGINITVGKSMLKATPTGLKGKLNAWGYEIDFNIQGKGPAFKPGSGKIIFPDGVYAVEVPISDGTFTARERTHGGKWHKFKGTAWVEHVHTTVMPQFLAKKWLRFQGQSGPYTVNFMELFATKRYAEERFGWLVVTKGNKVVAHSTKARVKVRKFKRDKRPPKHRVPFEYEITAPTENGPVTLNVNVGKLIHRDDILKQVPKVIRSILSMFIQPVKFTCFARFKLQLPNGKTRTGKRGISSYSPLRAQ